MKSGSFHWATLGVTGALLLCISGQAGGALICYDGFDYALGHISAKGAAADGWAGAWETFDMEGVQGVDDFPRVVAPGLTYTDDSGESLLVTGNGLQPGYVRYGNAIRAIDLAPGSNAELADVIDPVTGTIGKDGTTLWLSFLADGPSSGYADHWVGMSLYNGSNAQGTEELFLGKPSGEEHWGVMEIGGPKLLSDVPGSEQVFYAVRIDFKSGPEDLYLWLNPDLLDEPQAADAQVRHTLAELRFDRLRVAGSSLFAIDELRVGTSYQDVAPVPEPSSLCVFGALLPAFLALPCVRRRKR